MMVALVGNPLELGEMGDGKEGPVDVGTPVNQIYFRLFSVIRSVCHNPWERKGTGPKTKLIVTRLSLFVSLYDS
jgi:hypothetical protein